MNDAGTEECVHFRFAKIATIPGMAPDQFVTNEGVTKRPPPRNQITGAVETVEGTGCQSRKGE